MCRLYLVPLVQLRGHLLRKSYSLGLPYDLFVISICNFKYYPSFFGEYDFGSEPTSTWPGLLALAISFLL